MIILHWTILQDAEGQIAFILFEHRKNAPGESERGVPEADLLFTVGQRLADPPYALEDLRVA
jgi:hypothetical protein